MASSAAVRQITGYDPLGQITGVTQQVGSATPVPITHTWNLAGGLKSTVLPTGRTVTYTYDAGGRAVSITGSLGTTTNYASGIAYAPQGGMAQMTLGNGIVETTGYNSRLQPVSIAAGSLLTLAYGYGGTNNNGNVLTQTITRPNGAWAQSYGYDGVNRLCVAAEVTGSTGVGISNCSPQQATAWTQGFGYDIAGNRWLDAGHPGPVAVSNETPQSNAWYGSNTNTNGQFSGSTNNRIVVSGWSYDAAGNILAVGGVSRSFTYDAENRQITAVVSGATETYVYDGEGRRVAKTGAGGTTVYVYDGAGELAAEYPAVVPTTGGTQYLTVDTLGTTRLVTDATGLAATMTCMDYLPFGEQITGVVDGRSAGCFGVADPVMERKFTGKERDSESGLDFFGARYFSAAQGRFTSPDPESAGASLFDPQRWSGYSYAINNPYKFVDPDGEVPILLISAGVGAGVGAVGGAVFDVANQLIQNGGHFDQINGREVGAAALGGLVSGGIAGLTLGIIPAPATLTAGYWATSAVVNGSANAVGGFVQREIDPDASGSPTSDFITGALGGAVGTKVAYVRQPLVNVRKEAQAITFSNRRSLRPQKMADLNSRASTQMVKNIVTGSVAGTSVTNFFSNLWFDLVSGVSPSAPKREVVTSRLCSPDNPCSGSSPVPQQ